MSKIKINVSDKTHKKAVEIVNRLYVLETLQRNEEHNLRETLRDSGEKDLYALLYMYDNFVYDVENKCVVIEDVKGFQASEAKPFS